MDRTYSSGAAGSAPSAPASPSSGYPTAGNPGTGTPATKPGPYWYHMIMEELLAIIGAAGIAPAQGNLTQLLTALRSAGVFQTQATGDQTTKVATTAFVNPGHSISSSGYQKLPSGLIIQWGQGAVTASANTITTASIAFPVAFPNAVLDAVMSPGNNQAAYANFTSYDSLNFPLSDSTSKANLIFTICSGIAITNWKYRYLAIGY